MTDPSRHPRSVLRTPFPGVYLTFGTDVTRDEMTNNTTKRYTNSITMQHCTSCSVVPDQWTGRCNGQLYRIALISGAGIR